jgi:DNA-binding NarL/FixJ family response regulator
MNLRIIETRSSEKGDKMATVHVMLADDHDILRQGLSALLRLEENIHVIGEANSGEQLLQAVQRGARPDVVLMDIVMSGMSGIEATRQLKQRLPNVQVIGLTASDEDETIFNMMQAGACSYLIKSMSPQEVVQAIHAAYNRDPWVPASIQRRLPSIFSRPRLMHNSYRMTPPPPLTQREQDVMQTLLQGYSNKEIARHLVISERTVQTHLSNIFTKLNVTSRTEAVLIAMRDGWLRNH